MSLALEITPIILLENVKAIAIATMIALVSSFVSSETDLPQFQDALELAQTIMIIVFIHKAQTAELVLLHLERTLLKLLENVKETAIATAIAHPVSFVTSETERPQFQDALELAHPIMIIALTVHTHDVEH